MDAITLLKNDHHKVDGIFKQFEQGGSADEFQQLFEQLHQELTIHTMIEEKIFYPAVQQIPELKSLVQEAYQEHAQVKEALSSISGMDNTTATWSQEMTKLMQDVKHHVEEEETEMFPQVQKVMTSDQLENLGRELESAKTEMKNAMRQPVSSVR